MTYEKANAEIVVFEEKDFTMNSPLRWCDAYGVTDYNPHTCYDVEDAYLTDNITHYRLYNCYDVSPQLASVSGRIPCIEFNIKSGYVQ